MTMPSAADSTSARFNPLIRPYLVLYVAMLLSMTFIGIPLAVLWVCGLGQWWARHYFDKLECELSAETLRFRKGIIFQVEKTVPLENIQDVTFVEGPLLRRFHLSVLKFETAGQSAGQAHDMQLIGIIDAHDFRKQILHLRTLAKRNTQNIGTAIPRAGVSDTQSEVLERISAQLDELIALARDRQG